MRITANQLTSLRLVLLPVPVAMVYHGVGLSGGARTGWLIGALAVYFALGLTDVVDGYLARRYGSTPLGAFLDPIADKIFLVAAYCPLTHVGPVPLALVCILFVRELAVTALRSIALHEGFSFRTTRLAKLKTTVQMAGAGFILLIFLFPDSRIILPILATAVAGSWVPFLVALFRRRVPGWRASAAMMLITGVGTSRLLLSRDWSILAISLAIVGMTVLSGSRYAWSMRAVLRSRFRSSPLEAVRFAALSLAVPSCILPVLGRPDVPAFGVMTVLAAELAAGGLDNSLVQSGRNRGPAADLIRAAVQVVAGSVLLLAPGWGLPSGSLLHLMAWGVAAVTLGDFCVRCVSNRDAFDLRPAAATSAPESPPATLQRSRGL